nr:uncharacterized protein LOC111750510 [Loxodonta africana]
MENVTQLELDSQGYINWTLRYPSSSHKQVRRPSSWQSPSTQVDRSLCGSSSHPLLGEGWEGTDDFSSTKKLGTGVNLSIRSYAAYWQNLTGHQRTRKCSCGVPPQYHRPEFRPRRGRRWKEAAEPGGETAGPLWPTRGRPTVPRLGCGGGQNGVEDRKEAFWEGELGGKRPVCSQTGPLSRFPVCSSLEEDGHPVLPAPFVKKTVFSPFDELWTPVEDQERKQSTRQTWTLPSWILDSGKEKQTAPHRGFLETERSRKRSNKQQQKGGRERSEETERERKEPPTRAVTWIKAYNAEDDDRSRRGPVAEPIATEAGQRGACHQGVQRRPV